MASERGFRAPSLLLLVLLVLLAMAGTLALAAGAGALRDSPRLAVLCMLAAVALALVAWRAVAALGARGARPAAGKSPALALEQQTLLDNALALEARLEHAPIALFRIDLAPGATALVCALNANARRLVAPGRATDPDDLYRQLIAQPVDRRSMIGFDTERGVERALVAVSALSVRGSAQRLVALMPVESELEAEALNAWRQLVHVLTHEIMNSLTPVASLSRTAYDLLDDLREHLPADVNTDLAVALDAISRRAGSLVEFVGSYRSLSNVPPARAELLALSELFERVAILVAPAWRARGGSASFSVEPASLVLMVDAGQLEQALINLLGNAFEATAQVAGAHVNVSARLGRGARLRIDVVDNGPGVPDALIAHIFTPFFTTKKQGGGIGLAMVRQLIHCNGGTVRYAKSIGPGARFVITF
ncbi:sensor histidine kinase [Massilia sp. TSP1-1-2]|uniref:sensor histidine kinase n=1 Tax=Massilia sp. TSP1-1-2 TaxID=2804649 RepID=UPI003CFA1092